MSIQIQNLSKVFGSQKAVNNISFEAKPGEILGFLGPNGAGKSTTMKVISCFLEATEGSAKVCGFDTQTNPLEVRKRLGYLPEHNPLYKDMYVKEYLAFVARLHRLEHRSKRVGEMIEKTGLEREQHKKISALSKGYRQRVGLAQAMIHEPEVLILDEPTNGLDPNQLLEIRKLIQELGKDKTLVFSSHIMQEVQAVCDRVIIINKGEIVANEAMSTIAANVSGQQIVELECLNQINTAAFKKLKGVLKTIQLRENRLRIISNGKEDLRPELFKLVVQNNWTLLEMIEEKQSVESIFQQLTQN